MNKICNFIAKKYCVFYSDAVFLETAVLPQKVTDPYVQSLRKREIENNSSLFQWIARPNSGDSLWGLPRFVDSSRLDTLPLLFKRMTIRQIQRDKNYRSIGVQRLLNKIISK